MLCIDGTFLTGKYKGQILTAIGVDGNNQVLPIAFAFVENENTRSWFWFLERVKRHVVAERPDVCLISDRHSGLLAAIDELQLGLGTEAPIWPDVRNRWCIRYMGANFYDHFKNKDLMDMFKRLCNENQQRKFNAMWKLLDQFTLKQAEEAEAGVEVGSSTGAQGHRRGRNSKPFTHWIRDAPKEKWSLLYDTDGSRYGIGTTNQAECYNMVLRPVRGLPLVGIVEYIMYGCTRYFIDRYAKATLWLNSPQVTFCSRISEYMNKKTLKAHNHNVTPMGTMERRYEVACNDRSRRGVRRERVVQECLLRDDGTAVCTCHKPRLLHVPCSHVIAACQETGIRSSCYVSPYFKKEAVQSVWAQEVYGMGILGPFTQKHVPTFYIPDPETKRGIGRRQTRRIRNNMDVAEAGKVPKICTQCGQRGHTYKKCPLNSQHDAAEEGPAGNPEDGAPPNFSGYRYF